MNLLKQIAVEVFHSGKSFDEIVADYVQDEKEAAMKQAKQMISFGGTYDAVRQMLIDDKHIPPHTATDLVQEALLQVARDNANEKLEREAVETAIARFKNHNSHVDVVNALLGMGCNQAQAQRIATDHQKYYR